MPRFHPSNFIFHPFPMRRPSPSVTIVLLLLLCALAAGWHRMAASQSKISPPESVVFIALRWVQRPLSSVGDWFSDLGRTMFRRGGAIEENEELRGQVANLKGQTQRLLRYQRENDELRRLLKMPRPQGGTVVAADIVSLDATDYRRRITLNVGSRRGVRAKDVAFAAQGVVGQVVRVDAFTCDVLLLTDRDASVGAMTQRTSSRGVAQGTGQRNGEMTMNYLDYDSDVREGDLVVTSGDSAIFPRGLVIGRVSQTRRDKGYSRLTARVDPAVPFDQLSAVYVRVGAGP